MMNLHKIAQEMKEDYINQEHIDFSNPHETVETEIDVDPSVVLQEHEGKPRSYMVFNNLKNIIMDASELLSIMNENDELPAWTQELVSTAKMNVSKALDYVRAEKSDS